MRVLWLNGGIHIEPESDVETEALMFVVRSLRLDVPQEMERPSAPDDARCGSVDRGSDLAE